MSIELAATEDVTKTLCDRESREQENTSMKEKAIQYLTNTFAENMCYIIKTL